MDKIDAQFQLERMVKLVRDQACEEGILSADLEALVLAKLEEAYELGYERAVYLNDSYTPWSDS